MYSDHHRVRHPVPLPGSGKINTPAPLSSGKRQHHLETPQEASKLILRGCVHGGWKGVMAFGPPANYRHRTSLLHVRVRMK